MKIAKIVKITYDDTGHMNRIIWVLYNKTNASISKKVRLLNELLNVDNFWFLLKCTNLFHYYRIYTDIFDYDYVIELIDKYVRTKKTKHIKAYIKYINMFYGMDSLSGLEFDPYEYDEVKFYNKELSRHITRKRGL